jgi:hypothetical protein
LGELPVADCRLPMGGNARGMFDKPVNPHNGPKILCNAMIESFL